MECGDHLDLNVSSSEASKGGVKYEVVLTPAVTPVATRQTRSPLRTKSTPSAEKIQEKLEQAAERRQSLESEKLASLQEKWKRIDEAAKKRVEEEKIFIATAKEHLENKMEAVTGNRENIISDLKQKLHSHVEKVEEKVEQIRSMKKNGGAGDAPGNEEKENAINGHANVNVATNAQ